MTLIVQRWRSQVGMRTRKGTPITPVRRDATDASTRTVLGRLAALAVVTLVAAISLGGIAGATWSTYHGSLSRRGRAGTGGPVVSESNWTSPALDGAVYTEPLSVGGRIFVATENGTIYALDAADGHVVWQRHVGTPVPKSMLPCGNIDPLGITGTPVVDTASGTLYAVAEDQGGGIHHELVAINISDGSVAWQRSADPAGLGPLTQQQRPALTIASGKVYWAFGGLAGDCGQYHGWLVGSALNGSGPLIAYQVPTDNEGAIWATPGPSVDSAGNLYVTTGNGSRTSGTPDHGNAFVKLDPNLNEVGAFIPTSWAHWNATDADLGSMGALLLPNGQVFAIGKQQTAYLVDGANLSGTIVGDQHALTSLALPGCAAFGGGAYRAPYIYVPCSSGIEAVRLGQSPPRLTRAWTGPAGTKGSPIVSGSSVWVVDYDNGWLYKLDRTTGLQLNRIAIGGAQHFTSVAADSGRVFVSTGNSVKSFLDVPCHCVVQGSPFGSVDLVRREGGPVHVRGWTIDPGSTSSIPVHVYVDGVGAAIATANTLRPDVGSSYNGYGPNHGFDVTVPLSDGTHTVCTYAISVTGFPNENLGCRTVSGSTIGSLDLARRAAGGVHVAGWALDLDRAAAIPVHVYVDGKGTAVITASQTRADIGAAFPGYGSHHGFDATIPVPTGPHTVCTYAIGIGPDPVAPLGCRAL